MLAKDQSNMFDFYSKKKLENLAHTPILRAANSLILTTSTCDLNTIVKYIILYQQCTETLNAK